MNKSSILSNRVNIFYLPSINHLHQQAFLSYSDKAPYKAGAGRCNLNIQTATHDAPSVFFCVQHINAPYSMAWCVPLITVVKPRSSQWDTPHRPSMVALMGQPSGWLVSVCASIATPVNVTTPNERCNSGGDSDLLQTENIPIMTAPNQTQFKFLFLCVKRSDVNDIPHRLEAIAPDEQNARLALTRDYILSFAGRLPVLEVNHG